MKNITSKILFIGLVLIMFTIHIWKLDSIPRGLYVDESSIGLNAALVAKNGYDEHNIYFPLYFEAFGEFKNPIYIYSSALIFKLINVSIFHLRLTSFILFSLFLVGLLLLVKRLFKNETVIFYSLFVGGTLPWFFNLSRIAFEVITQLTLIMFCLYFVYRIYCDSRKQMVLYPLLTGLLIGVSVYSFTTARLLSFVFLLSVLVIYHKQFYKNLIVVLGFLISIIPYLNFYLTDPSKLTSRFKIVSYIYDTRLTLIEKLTLFFENYLHYLSPDYLIFRGDSSSRHHIGYGGELYFTVLILSVVGISWLFIKKKHNNFTSLLLINLLLAPVAAALTTGDSSLRSILVGLYLLIFSIYGLHVLINIHNKNVKLISLIFLTSLLVVEAGGYLINYFLIYPQKSVWAFESFDLPKSMQMAVNQNPTDIIVSSLANNPYAHVDFYKKSIHVQTEIPINVDYPVAQPGRCIIYFASNQKIINENIYKFYQIGDPLNYSLLKCF